MSPRLKVNIAMNLSNTAAKLSSTARSEKRESCIQSNNNSNLITFTHTVHTVALTKHAVVSHKVYVRDKWMYV